MARFGAQVSLVFLALVGTGYCGIRQGGGYSGGNFGGGYGAPPGPAAPAGGFGGGYGVHRGGGGGGGYSGGGGGYSGGSYQGGGYERPSPYDFSYDVRDEQGNTHYRKETGDGSGGVKGSYGYTDTQGLYRVVDYIADAAGFRANVRTNEPGTDNKSPADVNLQAAAPPAGVYDTYRYTPRAPASRPSGGAGFGGGIGGGIGGGYHHNKPGKSHY